MAIALAALVGCSLTPSEDDPVQVKLGELDGRIGRIERVMSNQSLLDMAQRLDASQTEIRQLRGRIEELENEIEAAKKRQRDLYNDLEKRLGQGGAGAAAPGAGFSAGGVPTQGGVPGVPVTAGASAEEAAYNQAFDALKTSSYPAAIANFKQFIASYPHSDLLDNARYWLGEAYYVTRDFPAAAAAFQQVVEAAPNSRKAPDAMLKLAYTQQELKRVPEARTTLTQVVQRYPGTDAARLATERLQRLPSDGP
jgi:tol-pal system protein YbgF